MKRSACLVFTLIAVIAGLVPVGAAHATPVADTPEERAAMGRTFLDALN